MAEAGGRGPAALPVAQGVVHHGLSHNAADFVVQLRSEGLREALATLLERTDYRFIGIWRFQDGKANAAVHCDREMPAALTASELPDNATYCCFVRETGAPFKTPNALMDERLEKHPARAGVLGYSASHWAGLSSKCLTAHRSDHS